MDFISKENKKIIEALNEVLGTKYRTIPYDFKNPNDVVEAIKMLTAEYCDYAYYWSTLNSIEEALDETVEVFSPAAWANIGLKGSTNNKTLDMAIKNLRKTTDLLSELMESAEIKCREVWKIALNYPSDEVITYFFESNKRFDNVLIDKVLDNLFEIFVTIVYDGVIETSAKNFAHEFERILNSGNEL